MRKPWLKFLVLSFITGLGQAGECAEQDTLPSPHLFNLEPALFGKGADKTFRTWEKDFIDLGLAYEEHPGNYVREFLGWFGFSPSNHNVYQYFDTYSYKSGDYYYQEFATGDPDVLYYEKEVYQSAYLFHHLDRSGGNISSLWNVFGSIINETVSPLLRPGRQERIYALNLISAWECLKQNPGYDQKMIHLYNLLEESYWRSDVVWSYLSPMMCPAVTERIEKMAPDRVLWFYTFWARRHHEGNAEAVYRIMKIMLNEGAS
jgi:hypothetical protein